MELEPQTNVQRREVQRSRSGTISFSGSTQALFSALSPAHAYLDMVVNLEHRGLGQAMTLQQTGSQHPQPRKQW